MDSRPRQQAASARLHFRRAREMTRARRVSQRELTLRSVRCEIASLPSYRTPFRIRAAKLHSMGLVASPITRESFARFSHLPWVERIIKLLVGEHFALAAQF